MSQHLPSNPTASKLNKKNHQSAEDTVTSQGRLRFAECTWEEAQGACSWRREAEEAKEEGLLPADSTKHQTGPTEHVQHSIVTEQK